MKPDPLFIEPEYFEDMIYEIMEPSFPQLDPIINLQTKKEVQVVEKVKTEYQTMETSDF